MLQLQNLFYQFRELRKARLYVAAEVHAQRAALAVGENLKVPASLRRFHHSESVLLSGNRQVGRVVAGDLQEDAAVGPAFVSLPGGVQESRAEPEAGRDPFLISHHHPQSLQERFVLGIHFYICQQREIIAVAETGEVSAEVILQRATGRTSGGRAGIDGFRQFGSILFVGEKFEASFFDDRFFGGKRAFAFVLRGELLGYDFAGFDVGLVEGVDPEYGARDGSSNLPAEKFWPKE